MSTLHNMQERDFVETDKSWSSHTDRKEKWNALSKLSFLSFTDSAPLETHVCIDVYHRDFSYNLFIGWVSQETLCNNILLFQMEPHAWHCTLTKFRLPTAHSISHPNHPTLPGVYVIDEKTETTIINDKSVLSYIQKQAFCNMILRISQNHLILILTDCMSLTQGQKGVQSSKPKHT